MSYVQTRVNKCYEKKKILSNAVPKATWAAQRRGSLPSVDPPSPAQLGTAQIDPYFFGGALFLSGVFKTRYMNICFVPVSKLCLALLCNVQPTQVFCINVQSANGVKLDEEKQA